MEKKFSITIKGMHCSGCKNLITLSLEEAALTNIVVDERDSTAQFVSGHEMADLPEILDTVFAELPDYSYTNLQRKD